MTNIMLGVNKVSSAFALTWKCRHCAEEPYRYSLYQHDVRHA
jgi:hypothetical protein